MRLTVRMLGLELLSIEASTEDTAQETDEPGDAMSTPVGFTRNETGCEWQAGVER